MESIPVLLIAYNRPLSTRQSLNHIREYGPSRLYVACDGPKNDSEDKEAVENVRGVLRSPGWQSERFEKFSDQNLGPGKTVASAISWFFQNEEMGIILEDDCLASPAFFHLAEHFLVRFQHDNRIWGFTGSNTIGLSFHDSYGFIRQPLTWGWASWASRWIKHENSFSEKEFLDKVPSSSEWPSKAHRIAYSRHLTSIAKYGTPDAWDYQWAWTVMKNRGLWGVTREHLVENIGFGEGATNRHPKKFSRSYAQSLPLLEAPNAVVIDNASDLAVLKQIHNLLVPLWLNYPVNLFRRFSRVAKVFLNHFS